MHGFKPNFVSQSSLIWSSVEKRRVVGRPERSGVVCRDIDDIERAEERVERECRVEMPHVSNPYEPTALDIVCQSSFRVMSQIRVTDFEIF